MGIEVVLLHGIGGLQDRGVGSRRGSKLTGIRRGEIETADQKDRIEVALGARAQDLGRPGNAC
jgi:hypothetical protein